jgi:hypothetical protein
MSPVDFAIVSDFRWILVIPVLLWVTGAALYASEPNRAREMVRDPS